MLPHAHQLVGDLRHRADHHDRRPLQSATDDPGHTLDRIRAFHRRPAKFHDNHVFAPQPPFQTVIRVPVVIRGNREPVCNMDDMKQQYYLSRWGRLSWFLNLDNRKNCSLSSAHTRDNPSQIFHPPHRNSELYFSPQIAVTKTYTVVVRAI